MYREIVFRGKSINTNSWVYGDLRQDKVRRKVYIEYEVEPSTVGQYTGIKDKNGNKIFEGDILDFTVFDCFDNDKQYKGVVKYDGSRFMVWHSWESEFYGADGGFELDWVADQDCELTVIGNIFENKELLK